MTTRDNGAVAQLRAENVTLAFHLKQMLDSTGALEPRAFPDDHVLAAFLASWNRVRFALDQRRVWAGLGTSGEGQP